MAQHNQQTNYASQLREAVATATETLAARTPEDHHGLVQGLYASIVAARWLSDAIWSVPASRLATLIAETAPVFSRIAREADESLRTEATIAPPPCAEEWSATLELFDATLGRWAAHIRQREGLSHPESTRNELLSLLPLKMTLDTKRTIETWIAYSTRTISVEHCVEIKGVRLPVPTTPKLRAFINAFATCTKWKASELAKHIWKKGDKKHVAYLSTYVCFLNKHLRAFNAPFIVKGRAGHYMVDAA